MNKKSTLILLCLLILISFQIKSQVFFGGQISTEIYSNDLNNHTEINFSPHAGYFVMDNMAAGGRIVFEFSKNEDKNTNNDQTNRTFGFGGFTRHYFPVSDNISLFGHAYGDLLFNKSKQGGVVSSTSTDLMLGIRPAVSFSLSNFLDLEIMFGNLGFGINFNDGTNTFGFGFNVNYIGLGLSYVLDLSGSTKENIE